MENTWIFHKLQISLTNTNLLGLSLSSKINLLPYTISIGGMRLRPAELQKSDKETQKLRASIKLQEGYKGINRVLHHKNLFFLLKAIQIKLISWYHNNLLRDHFDINKAIELIGPKMPLAKPNQKCWNLCQRLWHMLELKNSKS